MKYLHIILLFVLLITVSACSTTRILQEGECRLAKNTITVINDKKFNQKELEKYIKQKANPSFIFGWSPFVGLYNMSSKNNRGVWNKVVRTLGTAPVIFDSALVDASAINITRQLEYLGYYKSKVDTKIHIHNKIAKVNYNITLGNKYKIDSIYYTIPSQDNFATNFYKDTTKSLIQKGNYLSEQLLEKEAERSSAYFRGLGYYGFTKNYYYFNADTLNNNTILNYSIKNYTRNETPKDATPILKCKFGSVNIYYPQSLKFNNKILTRLNKIEPGKPYSEYVVNTTYKRLSAIRLFNSVNIELDKQNDTIVNCNINLTPSQYQGFKANLEWSTNSSGLFGISPGITYYNKNIFHGGEWLNLSFTGNFQFMPKSLIRSTELGVSSSLTLPRFIFLPYYLFNTTIPKSEIKISYNYQNRPEYRRNVISTSFGYIGSHKNLYYQFYPLQVNVVRLYALDQQFYKSLSNNPFMRNSYKNHFDIGTGLLLYLTNTTAVVPKSTYYYSRLQLDIAGNTLSLFKPLMKKDENGDGMIWGTPYSQYIRGELTLSKTWFFGKNNWQSIATRLLAGAGYAYGNSKVLPFEQHFYGGGANSLRGWQARSVGPGLSIIDNTFVIPNQSGDMRLEANIEYRFNLFWKFAGALFIDAGNVWTYHNNKEDGKLGLLTLKNFGKSIAIACGTGIRLDLNFLLLRVDMGMKVHNPALANYHRWVNPNTWFKGDNYAIHFGVGYPF